MRIAAIAVLLIASTAFGQDAMHCQSLDALTVAPDIHEVCTFPDGSGMEITTVDGQYSRVSYASDKWNLRLAQLLKADTDAANHQTALLRRFAGIEGSRNAKDCRANGGVWQSRECLAAETYIESSTNQNACKKRGGLWKANPPDSDEHICLAPTTH